MKILLILALLLIFNSVVLAEEESYKPHGFIDQMVYTDNRGFTTFRLKSDLELPLNLEYFQFANFNLNDGSDFYSYYTEQSLYHKTFKEQGVDLAAQFVGQSGEDNNSLRLGTRVRLADMPKIKRLAEKLNIKFLNFSFFPYQIDGNDTYDMAMEHFYHINLFPKTFNERVFLQGFVDHNIQLGKSAKPAVVVSETRLGVRIYKGLYLASGLRYDNIRNTDQIGASIELEYFGPFNRQMQHPAYKDK